MKYEECYNMIIENFKNKIQTSDKLLKMKIFNNLVVWYKQNYEDELKKHFQNDNKIAIDTILKQIGKICNKSDLQKMKLVYMDEKFEEFMKISDDIFSIVSESVINGKYSFTEKNLNDYIVKLDSYELLISKIFIDEYNYYKSECVLDLNFLKAKGNVSRYSLRTHRLLESRK